ncbi:hypothetical protein NADFUDRAFT_83787 [Nadsonia fulvescens var. elongata DSM 6958]|uniref:Autophagy-related protein 13 n=1 Tax=Nadsonia fulvescens var. elongata DSM 6958 TaxID=857566 RepID=A0A1E3PFQ7_9ASCO|nr:hypothetical protein NADFUDRAFT_83787 [Nadsonia fulvescens var. elongata DSM 6958]
MSPSPDPHNYRDSTTHTPVTSSSVTKINQVVHNLFSKAAHVVVQSRTVVNPVLQKGTNIPRVNKWFNLELEESESLRNDLKLWRSIDAFAISQGSHTTPSIPAEVPPLVIESYLNLQHLQPNQTAVLVDPLTGKKWPTSKNNRRSEVVIERWVIELLPSNSLLSEEDADLKGPFKSSPNHTIPLNLVETLKTKKLTRINRPMNEQEILMELPIVYKKSIVLFRSLYTYCLLLPLSNLRHNLSTSKLANSPFKVDCRVLDGSRPISSRGRVGLTKPIIDTETNINSADVNSANTHIHTESYTFVPLETPVGLFRISVTYRKNCDFAITDSESTLNSFSPRVEQPERQFSNSLGLNEPSSYFSQRNETEKEKRLDIPIEQEIQESSSLSSPSNKGLSPLQNTSRRFSIYSANNYDLNNPLISDTMPSEIIKNRRKSSIDSANRAIITGTSSDSTQDDNWSSTATSSAISVANHASTTKKSSVSFIQPFKTPSLSASPSSFDSHQIHSSLGGQADLSLSRPSPVSRISSNSSLAALRAPNPRSLSNASASDNSPVGHFKGILELSGLTDPASGSDMNSQNGITDTASVTNIPRASPISRSGSISKYSSSFGSKSSTAANLNLNATGSNNNRSISRTGSFSSQRIKRPSFSSGTSGSSPLATSGSAATSLYGTTAPDHIMKHQMGSSAESPLEPGSEFLIGNNHGNDYRVSGDPDDDLGNFVKMVDSIRDQSKGVSSSSLLNSSMSLEAPPSRDSSLITPEFPDKGRRKLSSPTVTNAIDPLARFQQMRYNYSELSESISSSASSISVSPHSFPSSGSFSAQSRPRLPSYSQSQSSFSGGNNNSSSGVYSRSSSPVGRSYGTSPYFLHTPVIPSRLSEEYRAPSNSSATASAESLDSRNASETSHLVSRNSFNLGSNNGKSDSISRIDNILHNRSRSRSRIPTTSPNMGFVSPATGNSLISPSSLPSSVPYRNSGIYSRRPSTEQAYTNATSSPLDIPSTPSFYVGPQLPKHESSLLSNSENGSKVKDLVVSHDEKSLKLRNEREGEISKISALSTSTSQYRPQYNIHHQLLTPGDMANTTTSIDISNYYRNNSFVSLKQSSRSSLPLSPSSSRPVSTGVTPSSGMGEFISSKKFSYYLNDNKSNKKGEDVDGNSNMSRRHSTDDDIENHDEPNTTGPHDGFMPNIVDDDDLLFAMSDMGLSTTASPEGLSTSLINYGDNQYNHGHGPNYGWKRSGYSLDS